MIIVWSRRVCTEQACLYGAGVFCTEQACFVRSRRVCTEQACLYGAVRLLREEDLTLDKALKSKTLSKTQLQNLIDGKRAGEMNIIRKKEELYASMEENTKIEVRRVTSTRVGVLGLKSTIVKTAV